jgi:cell division cycle 20-like protein 1 (cofactor of APC complex)
MHSDAINAEGVQSRYEMYLKKELLHSFQKKDMGHSKNSKNIANLSTDEHGKAGTVKLSHSFKKIRVPSIIDDFYLNLLDWSCHNILAIGLKGSLFTWAACSQKASTIFKEPKPNQVCSVKFNLGEQLAMGNNEGTVRVLDLERMKESRVLIGHQGRVGSLDWSASCLASGSRDGRIVVWDVRVRSLVSAYKAHRHEISGLKWNGSGSLIASGGNDSKLVVHDNRVNTELARFSEHRAAIKALDWCPENTGVVAAGGGTNDQHIRFFNTKTLTHEFSIDTGSQICNLAFSKISTEMVTTHGYSLNHINIWNSNNLWKTKHSVANTGVMMGHLARVLYLATGPNGDTVATAAGDHTIRFWHPFQTAKIGDGDLLIPQLR